MKGVRVVTFKKFETLFKGKYPNGTVFPHDVFEHGVPGRIQKVHVTFSPNGKGYFYRGAYEDILCKIGIPVISKERFTALEGQLEKLKDMDGKTDEFFGGVYDWSTEIERLSKEIEDYKKNYVIA